MSSHKSLVYVQVYPFPLDENTNVYILVLFISNQNVIRKECSHIVAVAVLLRYLGCNLYYRSFILCIQSSYDKYYSNFNVQLLLLLFFFSGWKLENLRFQLLCLAMPYLLSRRVSEQSIL